MVDNTIRYYLNSTFFLKGNCVEPVVYEIFKTIENGTTALTAKNKIDKNIFFKSTQR